MAAPEATGRALLDLAGEPVSLPRHGGVHRLPSNGIGSNGRRPILHYNACPDFMRGRGFVSAAALQVAASANASRGDKILGLLARSWDPMEAELAQPVMGPRPPVTPHRLILSLGIVGISYAHVA